MRPLLPPRLEPAQRWPEKVLERDMRAAVKQLVATCGFKIWDLEQGYRAEPGGSRQTRGLPDLICLQRIGAVPRILWAIQVKGWRTGHKETPEQGRFGRVWEANGGRYTCGTLVEVEDALVELDLATRQDRRQERSGA